MTDPDPTPWYRQFWPWFLIAMPGTVVIASMVTLYLALQQPLEVDPTYGRRVMEVTREEPAVAAPADCAVPADDEAAVASDTCGGDGAAGTTPDP